jgi:inosine-uridine nucleoside N-ribohydrolase
MPLRGNDEQRARLLASRPAGGSGARPRMILDTDTYNEIDDQFALVHTLLSPDRVDLEAIYAAPFANDRSNGPADGMRKSFEEIHRILELAGDGRPAGTPVLEGATRWLSEASDVETSPATADLIERCSSNGAAAAGTGEGDGPVFVVAIGAPTNISAALLLAPEITERLVVIWLGGNSLDWPTAREFNLQQDLRASQVLFDSGVALVHVACHDIADHLVTSAGEIDRHVRPAGAVGRFLADRFADYVEGPPGTSKVIWDLAAVAWLLDASWTETTLTSSPVLTNELTWSADRRRHLIGEVSRVERDAIFVDLFDRLARHAGTGDGR